MVYARKFISKRHLYFDDAPHGRLLTRAKKGIAAATKAWAKGYEAENRQRRRTVCKN
jgi:hypothetical protein